MLGRGIAILTVPAASINFVSVLRLVMIVRSPLRVDLRQVVMAVATSKLRPS